MTDLIWMSWVQIALCTITKNRFCDIGSPAWLRQASHSTQRLCISNMHFPHENCLTNSQWAFLHVQCLLWALFWYIKGITAIGRKPWTKKLKQTVTVISEKKSDLVKKGYWNRIHSSVYMCKSDSTETWHNISETQIAKEKIKFVCASHKPVAEFLSCKAHQHKHKLKLYKFVMSDCAARYRYHSVFYMYIL